MISKEQFNKELQIIIKNGIREDIGEGDHSSLACIPIDAKGQAKLLVKEKGVIAGIDFAKMIFTEIDNELKIETFLSDGDKVKVGDIAFFVTGNSQSIKKEPMDKPLKGAFEVISPGVLALGDLFLILCKE